MNKKFMDQNNVSIKLWVASTLFNFNHNYKALISITRYMALLMCSLCINDAFLLLNIIFAQLF
jgi:hypothetical protein